ncbi:HD-GYP domain-containing protein [Bacillus sp. FJAT-26390]|uniref:HD-GYP domain-containing protein n=1 Tax=Bacillus sp. FJAT-26390 TaxID=1743142 RepID=UPI0009E60296|nr:HD domain-containing phosphohydrolase [Bacillus sp. FJAT-26390]
MTISPGYAEVMSLQQTNVGSWMKYLMYKSPATYRHCVRVALLAEIFAPHLPISDNEKEAFIRGSFLHDVGKVRVPNEILHKKGRLSEWEWSILRRHPQYGEEILINHSFYDVNILQLVRYHHERYDGAGYPDGLMGDQIPIFARACSIIDAFDSMLSSRPYRMPLTKEQAYTELQKNNDLQFDGSLVDLFLNIPDEEMGLYFSCMKSKAK